MSTPTARPTGWMQAPMRDLIRHIVSSHHAYLRRNLPVLADIVAEHGTPELVDAFYDLRTQLMLHIDKEEAVLFPAIDRMETALNSGEPLPKAYFGSMRAPVAVMEQEHELADRYLVRVRQLVTAAALPELLAARLRELDADLRTHMQLENEILFPRAMQTK